MAAVGYIRGLALRPGRHPMATYISLPDRPATGRQIDHVLRRPRPSDHRRPGVWLGRLAGAAPLIAGLGWFRCLPIRAAPHSRRCGYGPGRAGVNNSARPTALGP